jgi:hypothetical protein
MDNVIIQELTALTLFRFLPLFFILFVFTGCDEPCSNTIKAEVMSPDGKHMATAFIRDCGATTSVSPQVSLRSVGQKVAPLGNVFVGNDSDEIEIAWLSGTQLVIYSDCAVVRHETNYQGITIEKRHLR